MIIRYTPFCKTILCLSIFLGGTDCVFAEAAKHVLEKSEVAHIEGKKKVKAEHQKDAKLATDKDQVKRPDKDQAKADKNKNDAQPYVIAKNDDVTTVATKITKNIIYIIKGDGELHKKNPELFYEKIERVFSSFIAFNAVVRGVMGKYVHRVSSKNFDKFVPVFKQSLLRFYSQMLSDYKSGDMEILHISPPEQEKTDAYEKGKLLSVPVEVKIRADKQNYLLTYSMMKEDGIWKIRNITVDGINIGVQFRSQFAEAVKNYGSPEKVIDNWNKIMHNKVVGESSATTR